MIDPHRLPFRYLVFFFTLCFHVSFFKNLILSSNYRLKFNYKESFFSTEKATERFTDKYLELVRFTIRPKYTHSFDSDLRTPLRKKPRLRHNALKSNSVDRDKFRLIGNKKNMDKHAIQNWKKMTIFFCSTINQFRLLFIVSQVNALILKLAICLKIRKEDGWVQRIKC